MSLIVLIFVFTLWLAIIYAIHTNFIESGNQDFHNLNPEIIEGDLKILTWNISYLYGFGSDGFHYTKKSKSYYMEKMELLISDLKEIDADIIFLQETDFCASKSYGIDQVSHIVNALNLNYAYAKSWDVKYLPFPGLNIKNHFGAVKSGGSILTKMKIKNNYVHLHRKPKINFLKRLFYIFRYTQIVELENGKNSFFVMNNHLEAFDKSTRMDQSKALCGLIEKYRPKVIAGDFNTIADFAENKGPFNKYEPVDYIGDETYSNITRLLKDTMDKDEFLESPKKYYTFSSKFRERKLDHIFCDKTLRSYGTEVFDSEISDHLPLVTYLSNF